MIHQFLTKITTIIQYLVEIIVDDFCQYKYPNNSRINHCLSKMKDPRFKLSSIQEIGLVQYSVLKFKIDPF